MQTPYCPPSGRRSMRSVPPFSTHRTEAGLASCGAGGVCPWADAPRQAAARPQAAMTKAMDALDISAPSGRLASLRSVMVRSSLSDDASETDVTCGRVHRLSMARRRTIAPAVVGRTKMGASLQHLAWNTNRGLARIVACFHRPAARVLRHAAGLRRIGLVLFRVPVGRPFPDIADHVEDAVAVRRKGAHRRGAGPAIRFEILVREGALPGVGHVPAARREFLAP